jgi:hypothetical protein
LTEGRREKAALVMTALVWAEERDRKRIGGLLSVFAGSQSVEEGRV